MARYMEYDKVTGKILCFLNAYNPSVDPSTGLIEVPQGYKCNISAYVVRDGEIVRACETGCERVEREKRREEGYAAVMAIAKEFLIALLYEDDLKMAKLKKEAAPLKVYLGR